MCGAVDVMIQLWFCVFSYLSHSFLTFFLPFFLLFILLQNRRGMRHDYAQIGVFSRSQGTKKKIVFTVPQIQ